jgi:hypothetical protein
MMGQLESDRAVPDALFFGMRFAFRPIPSLEIGLTRSAQWCGEGRPCDVGTFGDLLLGRDNVGDSGISDANEPGNQLAGVDWRWSMAALGLPSALYGQIIGEDEAGGFPSRYIGLIGTEASGMWRGNWSWRWFVEFAGTSCRFHASDELFNCAYNHSIYRTGYRYRGRAIGHGIDNDARVVSSALVLIDDSEKQWRAQLRAGKLNRGGAPDMRNSLTAVPQDIVSMDLSHSRVFRYGILEFGLGYEERDTALAGRESDIRFFLDWHSKY